MKSLRDILQTCAFDRVWTTLLCAMLLSAAGYLDSLSLAQTVCGVGQTTPIRVDNTTELGTLRAAVNCTDGGGVEVDWAGVITLDSPISIADGTFLSITGEDDLAEVHGDDAQMNGTRLFEASPGGGLILTQMKVSGGTAGEGGAIYSYFATVILDSCVFYDNVATDGNGGAVWANGGNVTITGGEFLGNTAIRYGGAVHVSDGRLQVRGGARFEGNEASVGGALFCGSSTVASAASSAVLCSLMDAEFTSNKASFVNQGDDEDDLSSLDGGGAAAFHLVDATITDSVFNENYARTSGGALSGGPVTDVLVNGCVFGNNTAEEDGGAISASSMTLEGSTQLANNSANDDGGAVRGWDPDGTIVLNDVSCTSNSAVGHGGCFHGSGKVVFNDGTVMLNNQGDHGGSIYADVGSDTVVNGGEFTCRTCSRGGFLYAGDNTTVKITGGLFADNTATRRGGALYCSGNGVSDISIEGGTFRGNSAEENGGAIAIWGPEVLVTITGGTFENNTATFFGGFVFLEIKASINCEGALARGNFAGEQGGGFYVREATLVNSSCDLIANESPQGGAMYLTGVKSATFRNHIIAGNLASSGSVVGVALSPVVARGVTFTASEDVRESSFNRALQLDFNSTLDAGDCVFDGWRGDTVVYNLNSASSSLVLDSCDFSGSSASMAVVSPFSDAEIRNAVVSSVTFGRIARDSLNSSLTLVDRALDCSDSNACGPGECVDSALGVLCECLEDGECLNDGGELSLGLKTSAENETFSPEPVSYELLVSSASSGTTNAIWELVFEGGDLDLSVLPSSGVLPPGGSATVTVTGTPSNQDVGGDLISNFSLTSVGSAGMSSTDGVKLSVISTFYLCQAYEYALPLAGDHDGDTSCEQCATIEGEEGVDCDNAGATLASLPIRPGYWRSNSQSLDVFECLHSKACKGATTMSSSEAYCAAGYSGPYCAVCSDDYGSGVGNSCHACDDTKAHLLIAMGVLFCLVLLLLLLFAAVFLVGGLDAIDMVRHSVGRKFSVGSKASSTGPPVSEARSHERGRSLDATAAPAFSLATEAKLEDGGDGGGEGTPGRRRVFPVTYSDSDDTDRGFSRALGPEIGAGAGVKSSDGRGRHYSRNSERPAVRQDRLAGVSDTSAGGAQATESVQVDIDGGEKSKCCGVGDKFKRFVSRLPLDKLKILVVVWQILAVFSSITGVEFPASYAQFLSWISVVNLDIGSIFSASCVLPSVNFYASLLVTTLAPFVLATGLVLTYQTAKHRAGIGSAGVIARRAAWSRHVAAGLLLTFLVFTSTSTVVFKTFACDEEVVEGESYLRADYSISCKTSLHIFFKVYAGFMILVYPVGIPVLYAVILWENRELLNPRIRTEPDGAVEASSRAGQVGEDDNPAATPSTNSKSQTKTYSPDELQELEEKVQARRVNPELVPSMFLWKDFGPDLYYYEVVECGRRILLTGLLIFISPRTSTQAAMACLFAFASLLGFELMRPHLDPTDSWLYRLGCVIIFLSNFLALLIKVDAGEEDNRAAFGVLMVLVNMLLVVAVIVTSWFAVQQTVNDSREEENSLAIAKTMLTAEQFAAKSARLTRERRMA